MPGMPQVLPLPANMHLHDGRVTVPRTARLRGPQASRVQARLGLPEGEDLLVEWASASDYPQPEADESYSLEVSGAGIALRAATIWGVLHGLTTLEQLEERGSLPCCRIDDAPRFHWRGVMLDPARHFLSLGVLEGVIDGMARLKLNVLHLHLTDDQGFRFRSAAFPALASPQSYTAEELVHLVQFAAERGVRVVPEIDMPGHVTNWLAAYPHWGTQPVKSSRRFGVHPGCLNVADPQVREAVRTLLAEVVDVFPDPYVHIGGDEVASGWWDDDAGVQAFLRAQDLADARALQAWFNGDVVAALRALGRQAIAWDEVLHPEMPAGLTVQNWRGATTRDRALAAGADCIVSAGYYLDLFYPVDVHYAYDPAAPEQALVEAEDHLREDPRFAHVAQGMAWTLGWRKDMPAPQASSPGRLLGGEACLWGELVDGATLPARLWSRLPAVAERFWSPASVTDVAALRDRWPAWCDYQVDDELLALCEPVKWYGRLLGEVALNARIRGEEMPQARPYDADTPLNRPVDLLPPESLAARVVLDDDDAALAERCRRWRQVAAPAEAELQPVVEAIRKACGLVLECLNGALPRSDAREALRALYRPYGEYMPAVILHLVQRLQ